MRRIFCCFILSALSIMMADSARADGERILLIGMLRANQFDSGYPEFHALGMRWNLEYESLGILTDNSRSSNFLRPVLIQGERTGPRRIRVQRVTELAPRGVNELFCRVKKTGDKITAKRFGRAAAIVSVESKSGIGSATIMCGTRDSWPEPFMIRIHTRGLESFRLAVGGKILEWSVASTGDHPSRVSLREGKRETPLEKGHPLFSKARLVSSEKIPLDADGYFEIPIPAEVFRDSPGEITLSWIDFYR